MSVIQTIRDKASVIVIVVIAISLIGFILMDAGRSGLGGGVSPDDAIAKVNGTNLSYSKFLDRSRDMEQMYEMNGRQVDEESRQKISADTWRSLVEEELLRAEYQKLGIEVSDKELNDMMFGKNPPQWLTQQFTDPKTGVFDVAAAKQAFVEIKKSKESGNRDMLNKFYLTPMIQSKMQQKYLSLMQNSTYIPTWMAEKTMKDNEGFANISYVAVPYTTVLDSTIQVSDAQILEYAKKNSSDFEQDEPSRSISYVSFPFYPSADDSAVALKAVTDLRQEFASASDAASFVNRNGSSIPFYDGYITKAQLQGADSIVKGGVGSLVGPYIESGNYVISRVLAEKTVPDSVRARHILVSVGGKSGRDDATAKKMIDSIFTLIKGGANFAQLATQLSEDQGSQEKGGDLGYFANGRMVKEFNDFSFNSKTGSTDVVKTQFGYHLINITDQKNFNPAYKIAFMAKPIDASQATITDATNKANLFSGNSRTKKAFDANVQKEGLNKMIAADVKETDYNVGSLGTNRALVRDIFKADVGDVLDPVEMNDQFVVVSIDGEEKKGLPSAAKLRPSIESIVRNQEKGKVIAEKMKGATDLASLSAKVGQQVFTADSVLFVSPLLPGLGYELKVGGYTFFKSAQSKISPPIIGGSGVYVIQTRSLGVKPLEGVSSVAEMQKAMEQQIKSGIAYGSIEALRKVASISDNRKKFL